MKVLVAYYSETGNTERIAKAIYSEASRQHEAHLKRVGDISAETLNNYDLVFLGSACHSADLAAPVKKLLKGLPESPKFKLAGFFTHSVWTPEQRTRSGSFRQVGVQVHRFLREHKQRKADRLQGILPLPKFT